jgi:hypothetical protein
MKICSKCKIEKDISCFGNGNKNKDGLQYWCKKCLNELKTIKKYGSLENYQKIQDEKQKLKQRLELELKDKKICSKCKIEKYVSEFYIRKNSGKYRNECKECWYSRTKKYCKNNKDEITKRKIIKKCGSLENYQKIKDEQERLITENKKICSKCKIEKDKSEFHKDKSKKDGLDFLCKQCIKEKRIIEIYGSLENYDYLLLKKQENSKNRNNSIFYKLKNNISRAISFYLDLNNSSKKGDSCSLYLPFTKNQLKQHLESQFEDWMNWDNYGPASTEKRNWNIDHIIPQSILQYTSMEDENFKKCWSLENLRPLDSIENIKKGNKIIHT